MDENHNIDQIREQGWEQMATLLDEHMPHENKRPVIWWYWMAGAAALVLAVAIPWMLLKDDISSAPTTAMVDQESVISSDEQNSTPTDDRKEISSKAVPLPGKEPGTTPKGLDDFAGANSFDPRDSQANARQKEYVEFKEIEKTNGRGERKGYALELRDRQDVLDALDPPSNGHIVVNLDRRSLVVESPRKYLEPSIGISDELVPITAPESTGRFSVSVFSEMMWSFSDRFGFVNAGPGIAYGFGKWAVGLSGGMTIPLPRQKAFYASNIPFSGQYNFDKQQESFNQDASLSSSSEAVYYEKYAMNPGLMMNLYMHRELTEHWGISAGLGRIGFRYDFTQKAKPNQGIAARTELSDLKNSLWYGTVSVHYQWGNQWKIHGGARMINLLQPGTVGMLPAVRMEYVLN